MTDPTRISDDQHNNAPAVPQGWTFSVSDDDDGTWLRVKSHGGREAAFSAVNGGLAHDNRRSIASRVLLELKEALAATPAPAPAQEVGLTEAERVMCLIASGCIGTVKMTYDSGPYEITRTSINASRLIDAIIAALRAKGGK